MSTEIPAIRTSPVPQCFLCGSEGKSLYRDLADRQFGVPGFWQLKQCPQINCGLLWLDPAPVAADLHLAYQTYFTHGAAADGRSSFASKLFHLLYRGYQAAQYAPSILTGLHQSRQEVSRMFLDDLKPGQLLDVGCGDGIFLERMRRSGWGVAGLDFDAKAIAHAKTKHGLDLHCGDLANAPFPDNAFNAITMSHVIEHVPDPLAQLEKLWRLLKPGGRLVLTTPNSRSLGHQKFRSFWFGLDAPRHLNIYSTNTLAECARRSGFKAVRAFSTAARADFFFGGSYSIRDAADHRAKGRPRFNPARILKIMSLQYAEHRQLRQQPDCGEEAVLVASKEA